MRPLLIQGAHPPELRFLIDRLLPGFEEKEIDGFKFWSGVMPGAYPVVLSLTGIGQAMAAAAVAVAKHNFNPCAIINQGIAGGLVSEANVGDVIIGEYCINMNAFKTPFADRGEGSNSLKWKPKRSRGTGGGHEEISSAEDMSYVARKRILADAELLSLCRDTTGVGDKRQVLFGGVGTCETWNSEMDRIAYLHYIFGALCEEMEAAAAAQISQLLNIPFISIRIISNNITNGGAYDVATVNFCQEYVLRVCSKYCDILQSRLQH